MDSQDSELEAITTKTHHALNSLRDQLIHFESVLTHHVLRQTKSNTNAVGPASRVEVQEAESTA